jgi:hypothetical protein
MDMDIFICIYRYVFLVSLIPGRLAVSVRNPSDWRSRRQVNLFSPFSFLFPYLWLSCL